MGTVRNGICLQGILLDEQNNKIQAIILDHKVKKVVSVQTVIDMINNGENVQHAIIKNNQLYFDVSFRKNDYTGQIFGSWKCLEYIGCTTTSSVGRWLCECQCGCGTTRAVKEPSLQMGESRSCNKIRQFIDMTGKTYGPWKVVRHLGNDKILCKNIYTAKEQELVGSQLRYTYGEFSQLTNNTIFPYDTKESLEKYLITLAEKLGRKPMRQDIIDDLGFAYGTVKNYIKRFELENLLEPYTNISHEEQLLIDYIQSLAVDIEIHNRLILAPYEIDIYVPAKKIGIEYNGVYWHSTEQKLQPTYHYNKTMQAKQTGVRLIHIFSHEWLLNRERLKKYLYNILSENIIVLYARQCTIKYLSNTDICDFINANHIQKNFNCDIAVGLFYNNELVEVMTFGRPRFDKNNNYDVELLRLCTASGYKVIGGASKLFQHYLKGHSNQRIVSYCDLSKFTGEVYEKLGFTYSHTSNPNYVYINGETYDVLTRYQCMKKDLVAAGYDSNLSEEQIMKNRGYYKVYDCGNAVYIYEPKKNIIQKQYTLSVLRPPCVN